MTPPKSTHLVVSTVLGWFASAAMLLLASSSLANGKVYQVEVIIFERGAHSSGSDAEGWQKHALLEYPKNWQRLIDPEEEASRQTLADQEDSLRLSDEFLQTLAEERGDSIQSTSSATPAEPSSLSEGQEYFEYLPEQSLGLRKTRDALTRRNHYRVLFHETWLQPMTSPEKAPALILHGGKRYGDHYELQGYINLSVSRFLHIQTDLWLSEFSVNPGQDFGPLPRLPVEPQLADKWTSADSANSQYQPNDDMVNLTQQPGGTDWTTGAGNWQQEDASKSPYLVNQVTTLRQKRRMRSGELHYLDHPRFGVLIKITPQQNTNE